MAGVTTDFRGGTIDSTGHVDRLWATYDTLRRGYQGDMTPSYKTRKERVEAVLAVVADHQQAMCDAAATDFGCRPRQVTMVGDVLPVLLKARHTLSHLKEWVTPQAQPVDRLLFGLAQNRIMYQPLGVVGILAPWNFPFDLTFGPLVDILAAGNRALIKPSELTPACSELVRRMVEQAFRSDEVAVVTGGPQVAESFAALPFDHLLFTGGTRIGKKVMRAAADNLTPVTLELGGKSPAIVCADRLTEATVTDILVGKLFNGGQVCIAPDYVLLPEGQEVRFLELARKVVQRCYPSIYENPDYTSAVNEQHLGRLLAHLADARGKGAEVVPLSPLDEAQVRRTRKLPPVAVLRATDEMTVLQEELFGPILPLIPYVRLDDALAYVNARARPLALYVFTKEKATAERVLGSTISGGACVNSTMMHALQSTLPFGGVGASGMGAYHGFFGFQNFSKAKPVFDQARINASRVFHPPYGRVIDALLKLILRK